MIILTYDISDDRIRSRFSKFINKHGRKLQYSVYEIKNSQRILKNILVEIEKRFKKQFTGSDSILIFQLDEYDKSRIIRYGYALNEEKDVVEFE